MKPITISLLVLLPLSLSWAQIEDKKSELSKSELEITTTYKDIKAGYAESALNADVAHLYSHADALDFHGIDDQVDVLPLEMMGDFEASQGYDMVPSGNPLDKASQAVQIGRDLVALGSEAYDLVSKGTPITKTKAVPVSVLPVNARTGKPIDPMQMEYFSAPVVKEFTTKVKSLGIEVVSFKYRVVYQYGGRFNGKGKYLTGVSIFPVDTWAVWGWSFSASMKRVGISNRGSVENPIAGLSLNINYKFHSTFSISDKTDTIFINGNGEFRKY